MNGENFCKAHPEMTANIGVVKTKVENIEKAIQQLMAQLARNHWPREVTYIVTFLSSSLTLALTLLIPHLLKG